MAVIDRSVTASSQETGNGRFTTGNGDHIDGGDGDDIIDGNAGDDQIDGGIGNDRDRQVNGVCA